MGKYYTCDRETGTRIDLFKTIEEARQEIKKYELSDKEENIYEEDFYQIYDAELDEYID